MKNLLCEIYTEEMPARLVRDTERQFSEIFEGLLKHSHLNYGEIDSFGTPRRICIFIKDIPEKEEDTTVEVKGPSYKIAVDENGNKLPPYLKFLETHHLSESDIFIKEIKDSKYLYGKKLLKGRNAEDVLKELIIETLKGLHFTRPMHWESSGVEFIRPIRNILLLFGEDVLDIEYAGVRSNNLSFGLQIDAPLSFTIKHTEEYFKKIRENYVILSYKERRRIVENRIKDIARKINGVPVYTEDFLEEVVNMNEYPTPFLASIGIKEIRIPECIIESVIKSHLKSFPVKERNGTSLLPYFIGVRNGTSDFIENVRAGYERVAKARILDGSFFFEEDKKTPLEVFVEKLGGVVFMTGLGSMKEKTERLEKLAKFIAHTLPLSNSEAENLIRAAYLSKTDLVSNVVGEFPELEGRIGGIYARFWGENEEVATAISEQYLPLYSGDKLPLSKIGKILSIIDRIDTLAGGFIQGIDYSSSKDPFGLRRIASGVVQIVFSMGLGRFPLKALVYEALTYYQIEKDEDKKRDEVLNFLRERAEGILKEKGIRYDVANAVLMLPIDLMPAYLERASTIMKHLNEETLALICTTNKRIKNIIEKSGFKGEGSVRRDLLFDKAEEELYNVMSDSKLTLNSLLEKGNYEAALSLYYFISPSVFKFFDNVLVMDENDNVKNNRLSLLKELKNLFDAYADFSQITFEG